MDFRDLTYLLAIARQQNITRAAESLYLSQPTLSKFFKGLEGELGLPLFERLGNKYIPTYAGEQYIKKPRKSCLKKLYSISKRNALKEALPSAISSTATRGNAPTVLSLPYIT